MTVKQISVFLENKSGRLAEVTKVLGENTLDIRALSLADTTDFGILRLIVNDPEKARKVLEENGFTVNLTTVLAIAVEDRPGGLAGVLEELGKQGVGIEYMYAFVGKNANKALVIMRVEDTENTAKYLIDAGIEVLPAEKVYTL